MKSASFVGLDRARIDWSDPIHVVGLIAVALEVYWAGWFLCVNLFVMGYEEPTLRDQFGESYAEYTRRVPRWVGTLGT